MLASIWWLFTHVLFTMLMLASSAVYIGLMSLFIFGIYYLLVNAGTDTR